MGGLGWGGCEVRGLARSGKGDAIPVPSGLALASVVYAEPVYWICSHTGGERQCLS